MQERILSQRVLYLGHDRVYLECQSCINDDNFVTPQPLLLLSRHINESMVPSNIMRSDNVEQLTLHWHRLVQEYSIRNLSRREYRLPAISGLARLLAPRLKSCYLADLWSYDLARALSWTRSLGRIIIGTVGGPGSVEIVIVPEMRRNVRLMGTGVDGLYGNQNLGTTSTSAITNQPTPTTTKWNPTNNGPAGRRWRENRSILVLGK
jgi:hypothetical protein